MIKVSKNWQTVADGNVNPFIYDLQRSKGLGYYLDNTNAGGTFLWGGFTGNMYFGGSRMELPNGYSRSVTISLNAIFLFSCKGKLYIGSHNAPWLYEIDPSKTTIEEIITGKDFLASNFLNDIFELYPDTDAILYDLSVLKTNYKYQIFGFNDDATKWYTRIEVSNTSITVHREAIPIPNTAGAVSTNATRISSYFRTLEKEDFDPVLEYIQELADDVEDVQEDVAKLNSEARSKFVSR